jgi:hypothetical protein
MGSSHLTGRGRDERRLRERRGLAAKAGREAPRTECTRARVGWTRRPARALWIVRLGRRGDRGASVQHAASVRRLPHVPRSTFAHPTRPRASSPVTRGRMRTLGSQHRLDRRQVWRGGRQMRSVVEGSTFARSISSATTGGRDQCIQLYIVLPLIHARTTLNGRDSPKDARGHSEGRSLASGSAASWP